MLHAKEKKANPYQTVWVILAISICLYSKRKAYLSIVVHLVDYRAFLVSNNTL